MAPRRRVRRHLNREPVSLKNIPTEQADLEDIEEIEEECFNQQMDELDDGEDIREIFNEYRLECEQIMQTKATLDKEEYISSLEALVRSLLDQNECLVENVAEIKLESALRVKEMHRKLSNSASRTEEVMLALASHELYLKQFVEQHCCSCCGCDMRMMQFRMCHRDQCQSDSEPFQCRSYAHEWNSIVNNSSHWFAHHQLTQVECLHKMSSEIRFTNLVNQIDTRMHQLETENEEVKRENGLIRELNSMLSGRKPAPLMYNSCAHNQPTHMPNHLYSSTHSDRPLSTSSSESSKEKKNLDSSELAEDLLTFLSETGHDTFPSYLVDGLELRDGSSSRDCLDSCGGSRSDSLNDSSRLDNDSGCSTDLIPSQTDINSLLMSDCDEECEELIKTVLDSRHLDAANPAVHNPATGSDEPNDNLDRTRPSAAERLVPKLYSKLLYYLVQRNMLLRQFQHENLARQKCKQKLSSLADCVSLGLKDVELNAKAIKQIELCSSPPPMHPTF